MDRNSLEPENNSGTLSISSNDGESSISVTVMVPDEGFVAEISDFQDFANWEVIDYTIYPTNSNLLGPAHNGNNPEAARMVYKSPSTDVTDGEYNQESIVVKETFTWVDGEKMPVDAGAFLAMVKRGGDFNLEGSGWEYFMLAANASGIDARGGGELGSCQACHTAGTGDVGMDFVFDTPSEFAVAEGGEFDIFDNPTSWEQIDSLFGPDPLLGGGAHGGGDLHRVVYRWQPGAVYANGMFPVGTVLLKEVYEVDDNDEKTNITWTGMVKRGGDFNPDNGSWEWFMLRPETEEVLARGGDALGCNACHSAAGVDRAGGDFVFDHPGLDFD